MRILLLFYWFVTISKFIRKFAKSSRGRLIRGIFVSIIPQDPVQQPLQGDKEIHDRIDAFVDGLYVHLIHTLLHYTYRHFIYITNHHEIFSSRDFVSMDTSVCGDGCHEPMSSVWYTKRRYNIPSLPNFYYSTNTMVHIWRR